MGQIIITHSENKSKNLNNSNVFKSTVSVCFIDFT